MKIALVRIADQGPAREQRHTTREVTCHRHYRAEVQGYLGLVVPRNKLVEEALDLPALLALDRGKSRDGHVAPGREAPLQTLSPPLLTA